MAKKNILLIGILLVLIVAYAIFFTDWFQTRTIKIYYTMRPMEHFRARHDLPYILFITAGKFRLTEIKVASVDELQRNPGTQPLWHLVSDSNSIPVREFIYGQHIHGMKPFIEGEDPGDLDTNVVYRLSVAAGSAKGSVDFKLK